MSRFEYTLPSGAKFVVNGPPGATQAQADKIFYEQVAAGSLVDYEPGQTLTSTATQLTKFELSRLERGTAGVDNTVVYAISANSSLNSLTSPSVQTILSAIENRPIPASMPSLAEVPLTDPVDQSDTVLIRGNDFSPQQVGPLSSYQVQKLLAQTAKLVDQEFDQISLDKGIGRYGFTAYALEQVGYVKPGTSAKYFSNGADNFVAVMSSPSVWTGKGGVYSLSDLLASPEIQNKIQVEIMQQSYAQLVASGAIVETPRAGVSVLAGQVYTNAGLTSVGTLTGRPTSTDLNALTIASGAVNRLTSASLGSAARRDQNIVRQGITNQLNGDIGALILNAGKFGSQATALWAKTGTASLSGIASSVSGLTTGGLSKLGSLAGRGLTNIPGTLTGGFNNISKNLTNLVPPNLDKLTNSLNVFGKAGSFATNFANPLSSLNNLGGALQGQATAALGQVQALAGNLSLPTNLFGGIGDLASGTQVAGGFNNTVNRKTVDAAFRRILGSSKIPAPSFEYPGASSTASRLDIIQAQSVLKDLQNSSGRTFGQGVTI